MPANPKEARYQHIDMRENYPNPIYEQLMNDLHKFLKTLPYLSEVKDIDLEDRTIDICGNGQDAPLVTIHIDQYY